MIEPFELPGVGAERDLRARLRGARWADAVTEDWSMGTERGFLRRFATYWAEAYDWPARHSALARLPHRRAIVDGFGLHLLHYRAPAGGVPLLLMNGWPSSFTEYARLAPRLAAGAPAFDVVLPALPGFGFSDRPARPYAVEPADLYPKLMSMLGYERFMVAGTDIGSGVATRIALRHPDRVLGVHVSAVAPRPLAPGEPPLDADELQYMSRLADWERDEGGYAAIQGSKPQTLAFALADSPLGLASWILEKFRSWSDCGGEVERVFPLEALADNLMVYWVSNTISSSIRYYYEAARLRPKLRPDDSVRPPTAVGVWPHDLACPPRSLAERLYNVQRYTRFARGGHFPAWEAPDLYRADLQGFSRALNLEQYATGRPA